MVTLYQHQQKALDLTEGQNLVAYYIDMGGGKTFIGSEKAVGFKVKILIVCQKSKIQDWIEHFKEHYPIDTLTYDLTNKKDFENFINIKEPVPFIPVAIINYDLIFRRPALKNLNDFTLMLDESSIIQNEKTERWKFISKMHPKNVILLSGTPTSGKYENLWTQAQLLGWDISFKVYQNQYINWKKIDAMDGKKVNVVDMDNPYKNVDRLKRKFREHGAIFMKTEEFGIDLPEQTFIDIKVEASKEYKHFCKNHIVTLKDGTDVVGDTTLTQMLGERQLCGMYSKEKLQAFKELAESTQDRLIVFYNFNDELEALKKIAEELERPASEVNGHCKDLTSYEEQNNSITLIQYQAGSMGLNLQKANKIIYFSLPLMSELFEQSKKRIHRIGQKNTCFYYILLVKGSIEEKIKNTLKMRKDFTDDLFYEERR